VLWLFPARAEGDPRPAFVWSPDEEGARPLAVAIQPDSPRDTWIYPFALVADVFLALLKMLIVPIVLASIVSGVAGVGAMGDLRRLGRKTLLYYISTSLLAILVGQVLVTLVRPGTGARLGLAMQPVADATGGGFREFVEVIKRMVPSNVFSSLQDNGAMLSIIFFALILGYSITRTAEPHRSRIREVFESFVEVMMTMAKSVLGLLPYGVFALMAKVVAGTGLAPFKALLLYMAVVAAALVLHACVTLPLVLRILGGISPIRWAKAMAPALFTAFSTSSSSMTLPVTMETVEDRGRVSNRVSSFTLPLGATVNMDGTALYECIGVIFLAQYYASVGGEPLTLAQQGYVVVLALLASVGAAGIPSAGLVMMLTILSALRLPVEGAALLLAVDRPLDMMRTVVNVWSDSCGAAVIARTEGEEGPLQPAT
jgi:proton glutamate symport protein